MGLRGERTVEADDIRLTVDLFEGNVSSPRCEAIRILLKIVSQNLATKSLQNS